MTYIKEKGKLLKHAEKQLSIASTKDKNIALEKIAQSIENNRLEILKANEVDIKNGRDNNMSEALIDRLALDNNRLDSILEGINTVIKLPDPIWQSNKVWTLENGLTISQMATPLGVIGIVYESRPNVTVDAFSLALKSGNCIILRGSSSAINSNKALVKAIKEGLKNSPISEDVVQFVEDTNRDLVLDMLKANEYIDLIIPRGGRNLIQFVINNSTVPTLQTGEGNCHLFIDESADLNKAVDILVNAKTQRLGVCNACESLVIHKSIAKEFIPKLYERLTLKEVEIRGDDYSRKIVKDIVAATQEDYKTEYLDRIISLITVETIEEAISHINHNNTKHSDSIITENYNNASMFLNEIDAAAVYVNASTRFTDGGEFGFGAEIGISTQKLHARGPMGLKALTSTKFIILGNGQIR